MSDVPLLRNQLYSSTSGMRHGPCSSASSYISRAGRYQVKPVSFWGLVALIFFSVSGGPFGSEPAVSSGGPFWALIGFIVFPLIWCVPEALVTSELSSMFPSNSGFTCWVGAGFSSPFLGYLEGFCSFVSTVANCSVYPRLFVSCLKEQAAFLGYDVWSVQVEAYVMIIFVLLNGYVNYRGLHIVGSIGMVLLVLILLPFWLVVLLGLPDVQFDNLFVGMSSPPAVGSAELLSLFNVLFWNLNNWDAISTLAGEIEKPKQIIPKAMAASLSLIVFAYVLPIGVGVGIMESPLSASALSQWQPGYFQIVGYNLGGAWLSRWILLAAILATIGQFQSLMSSCAYQIEGMASLGWLPSLFALRTKKYNTPFVGLLVATCGVLVMIQFQFIEILEYLNVVYAVAMILEFLAFLNIRWNYTHIEPSFKIPLNFVGCLVLLSIPPLCILSAIIALPILAHRWDIVAVCVGSLIIGMLSYLLIETGRRSGWLAFSNKPPTDIYEAVLFHQERTVNRHSDDGAASSCTTSFPNS